MVNEGKYVKGMKKDVCRGFALDVTLVVASPYLMENKQTTKKTGTSPYIRRIGTCFVSIQSRRIVPVSMGDAS